MEKKINKEQGFVTLCKRMLILLLIERGVDGIMKISAVTGMSRRSIQESLKGLRNYKCEVVFVGSNRNGRYVVKSWGAMNRQWAVDNIEMICKTVGIDSFDAGEGNQ